MQEETGYALRKLTQEEWSEWDAFVFQQKEGTIFHTTHWLKHQPNRTLEIYVLLDFGKIVAGIPLSIVSKAGYKVVALPVMTPYSGPVLADILYFKSGRMEAFKQISSILNYFDAWRIKLHPNSDALKYQKSVEGNLDVRRTNIIRCTEEQPVYSSSLKRNLKKAKDANIQISETTDFDTIYNMSELSFKNSGRKHPLIKSNFISLASSLHDLGLVRANIATLDDGKPVACNWLPTDHHSMYNSIHGIDRKFKDTQAGALILDYSVKQAFDLKKVFDFEGSSADRINRFYKKFGATEKKITEISSIQSRFLFLLNQFSLIKV